MIRRHKWQRTVLAAAALVLVAGLWRTSARAQSSGDNGAFDILEVRPNFHMIAGAGGNIGVQTGDLGAVVVDTGSAAMADRILAEVRKLSKFPVRYIIDTSADADHIGGNEKFSTTGLSLIPVGGGIGVDVAGAIRNGGGAAILATENVLMRMSAPTGTKAPYPTAAWPTQTYGEDEKDVFLNGEGIQVFFQRSAHTDGDSIVFFRKSDVVVAGDVLDTRRFPVIDLARGGSIQGEIDALNHIIDITIPELPLVWQEGGTLVVPGHGRICDEADVVEYRDMITIIRDVIASMIVKGKTLGQIQAANPALEYRTRFGSDIGPWTTNMFVEAIYKGLTQKKGAAR